MAYLNLDAAAVVGAPNAGPAGHAGPAGGLAGFHGMRGDVLVALKKEQPLTARELAERFGVTANALRRHLKALEEAGLVRYRREVRGVGGPVYAYSLSEGGEGLFPRAYAAALTEALEAVREQQGDAGVVRLFHRHWSAAAAAARARLGAVPLDERVRTLAELLTEQGYMAESEATSATEARLLEHNCAIREVAERFPEACAAEAEFFEEVLGAEVRRRAHILSGCNACEYTVRAPAGAAAARPGGGDDGGRASEARIEETA